MSRKRRKNITKKNVMISIIISVFNNQQFLNECIDSVLNQSLKDIEVICVDNGSTDGSLEILNEYAKSDNRIHLFRQENTNMYQAFNKGIKAASGYYIHFLNANDRVMDYAYEALYNKIVKYDLDMIRFASFDYDLNKKEFKNIPENSLSFLRPGDFNRSIGTEEGSPLFKVSKNPWLGIYRRDFLLKNNIIFKESYYADQFFYISSVTCSDHTMISRDRLVFHRFSQVNEADNFSQESFDNIITSFEQIVTELQQNVTDFEVQKRIIEAEFDEFIAYFRQFANNKEFGENIKEKTKKWIDNYNGSFAHALRMKYYNVLKKINDPYIPASFNTVFPFHKQSEKPKVSVVVPTYNVEDYLNEALNSLTIQTLDEIEFVCINDGSTDGSLTILKEYAAVDKRFVILDGPNGGYGKGMNRGMDASRGEYLGILEPDDFVPAEMFKELYDVAKTNNLDFVKADFKRFMVNNDGSLNEKIFHLTKNKSYYNRVLCPLDEPETFKFVMNTWSGIYNFDFLRKWNIRHNETPGASYQDNGFWFQTFCRAKRAMFVDKFYYMNRRDNPNSSMFSSGKMFAVTDEYRFIYEILHNDSKLWDKIEGIYWAKKLDNFFVTLYRLKPELQSEYIQHLYTEFKHPYAMDKIDNNFIGMANWRRFIEIMDAPDDYLNHIRVSVIMAVYNSEKWVGQALDSLLIRNEIPFEIICVDDGSTDNSLSILRDYEKNDPRVRVITQKNAGAGAARNAGMELAKGEYLSFLDSDDFFESNMLRYAYDSASTNEADIVVFRSNRFWQETGKYTGMNFTIKRNLLPSEEPFAGSDIPYNSFRAFSGYAWDKLFRADFVRENNIKFLEQPCINDQMFTFCAIMKAEKICTNNTILAHYRRLESGLTYARDEGDKWQCFYNSFIAMRDKLKEWNIYEEREQDFINYCLYFCIWNLSTLHAPAYFDLYDKLKNEWFNELGITSHNADYFYNYSEWMQLKKILELSSEEYLFWRAENLELLLNDQGNLTNKAKNQLSEAKRSLNQVNQQLSGFLSARIDIKNEGKIQNDIILSDMNGLNIRTDTPKWFANNQGIGHVVMSNMNINTESGQLAFKLKAVRDGTLQIKLMGMDIRNSVNNRIHYWIDYTSMKINGKEVLKNPVSAWHNKPYKYSRPVKDGEVLSVQISFKSHAVGDQIVEPQPQPKPAAPKEAPKKAPEIIPEVTVKPVPAVNKSAAKQLDSNALKDKTVISWGGYEYFQKNVGKLGKDIKVTHISVNDKNFGLDGYTKINRKDILEQKNPYVIISQYNDKDIAPAAKWLDQNKVPFTHLSFLLDKNIFDGRFIQAIGGAFTDEKGNVISISPAAKGKITIDVTEAANASVYIGDVEVNGRLNIKLRGNKPMFSIGDRTAMEDLDVIVNGSGCVMAGDDCLFEGNVILEQINTHMIFDVKTGKPVSDLKPIRIDNHVWIGNGVRVHGGAEIGKNSIISENSAVAEKFPANVIIEGCPAKVIRTGVIWSRDLLSGSSVGKLDTCLDKVALSYMK